ncbi:MULTISPECIES: DUF2309 domain-containing protein [Haloferax]|uniref:Probable inorganic carbon transporter subunit DabA n=1 Tax=Haloferax marinum TaxID=2666143 RepID=A0A6A8G3S8_9EURY|nr:MULTISPECIES: DUF2309 domain-containing protein [Haloferax]KAB1196833.1 DUF2309 domain-containing protein [Haloferax sp. CBA1150]MRW95844.1 DUF2309 family protein [Haloferax marinum]
MNTNETIHDTIEQAATTVGSVWPLHSFVTANPLSGFEDHSFHEAVQQAERLFGGRGYPSADVFRAALDTGQIDPETLRSELRAHGYDAEPSDLLARMEADEDPATEDDESSPHDVVDAYLTKWLAAFLDEGQASWAMPNRDRGFYAAFRSVARHDRSLPDRNAVAELPDDPTEAIEQVVSTYPRDQLADLFEFHLGRLPGWTGFIKQRAASGGAWQATYPITLTEYLAVRLVLTDILDAPPDPPTSAAESTRTERDPEDDDDVPLPELWLNAWEATYRTQLVESITEQRQSTAAAGDGEKAVVLEDGGRPDAQLVFCIDTRSEVIRRHVEDTGAYETYGYAGFFGIPMRYEAYDSGVTIDACPPILEAQHYVTEDPVDGCDHEHGRFDTWANSTRAAANVLKSLKSNAATVFSFVESAGSGYGVALAARTLFPARVYDFLSATSERIPSNADFCEPALDYDGDADGDLPRGLSTAEKVEYAATAFELMGWDEFARVVAFVGHASQTANNPFESSLDCGACAGNAGGPSARVLAAICNDDEVKTELREQGFDIPSDTVFVAGEHNTTTDEVTLFTGSVPESHESDVERLRSDLETARAGAAAERTEPMSVSSPATRETERRATDWAETRPEWGLAGNAGFVVGPRSLTQGLDLDGRSFLHSYDWRHDDSGEALAAILSGPMVVTQWINMQYYFSTVDNAVYGSGSKITHNPVGNVGVYQGNGGDLMTGLPLQSVKAADDDPYHQPLRLSVVVHAPVERVTTILEENPDVTELLDNGWLSLTVVDPTQNETSFEYDGNPTWVGDGADDSHDAVEEPNTAEKTVTPPMAADD